jgi:stage II sporulation protein D
VLVFIKPSLKKKIMIKAKFRLLAVIMAVCISGCAVAAPGSARSGGKIRVLVLRDLSAITIKGARGFESAELKRMAPGMLVINGSVKAEPVRFSPEDELLYVDNRPYRGSIDVYSSRGGLMVVNELFLETYLVGIINHEISSKWPGDAVKAQAVISRTYALYQISKAKARMDPDQPYDIEGTVLGQVYKGTGAEDALAGKAVRSTAGEVLTYDGELALTVFHSNAGGRTEASVDVWAGGGRGAGGHPYLTSVKSPFDAASPGFAWEFNLPAEELGGLMSKAGFHVGEPVSVKITSRTRAGRVRRLVVKDASGTKASLTGEELRKIVGYGVVKSAIFKVRKKGGLFIFKGKGSGHGVGLSQWGAKGMAENGYSYRKILRHYYPGTRLKKAY